MQHLKDYVWMQLGNDAPIKVTTDDLTPKLAAGYRQVDEPAGAEVEGAE